jgi:hypothetical protein
MPEAARQTGARPNSTTKARPGDTAMRKQQLEQERDLQAAQQQAEDEAAEAAVQEIRKNSVIDYTNVDQPLPEAPVDPLSGDEDDGKPVVVRVKYDLPEMTYGREILVPERPDPNLAGGVIPAQLGKINTLKFEEGRQYALPKPLARHMDERGLLMH